MDKKTYTKKSRYGDDRIFEIIDSETITVTGQSHYMRCAYVEDTKDLFFIDYDGGPFISLGGQLDLGENVFEVYQILENENKYTLKVIKIN